MTCIGWRTVSTNLQEGWGDAGDTLDAMSNRLDAIELELKYIRDEMQRLDYGPDIHELNLRVERLEKRARLRK